MMSRRPAKRNATAICRRSPLIVAGEALSALEKALTDKEEVIREAAAWAIGRIRQRTSNRDVP